MIYKPLYVRRETPFRLYVRYVTPIIYTDDDDEYDNIRRLFFSFRHGTRDSSMQNWQLVLKIIHQFWPREGSNRFRVSQCRIHVGVGLTNKSRHFVSHLVEDKGRKCPLSRLSSGQQLPETQLVFAAVSGLWSQRCSHPLTTTFSAACQLRCKNSLSLLHWANWCTIRMFRPCCNILAASFQAQKALVADIAGLLTLYRSCNLVT